MASREYDMQGKQAPSAETSDAAAEPIENLYGSTKQLICLLLECLLDEERSERGKREGWIPLLLMLNQARVADAFVILWGEYGGSTHLIASARDVRRMQEKLDDVLAMLDQNGWNDVENAVTCFLARQEAIATVKSHHVRVGDKETWIAQTLLHLTERSIASLEGGAQGG